MSKYLRFTLVIFLYVQLFCDTCYSNSEEKFSIEQDILQLNFQSPQALVAFEATLETVFIFFLSYDFFLKIMFCVISRYLGVIGHNWACLGMLGCAWVCLGVLGRAWACLGVVSHSFAWFRARQIWERF